MSLTACGAQSPAAIGAYCCSYRHHICVLAVKRGRGDVQVVDVLSKRPQVLKLIGVDTHTCTRGDVLEALARTQEACSKLFLAKVSKLQLLEDAVACELVRGRHPLLSAPVQAGTRRTYARSSSGPVHSAAAPTAPPPPPPQPEGHVGDIAPVPCGPEGDRGDLYKLGAGESVLGFTVADAGALAAADSSPDCRPAAPDVPARPRGAAAGSVEDEDAECPRRVCHAQCYTEPPPQDRLSRHGHALPVWAATQPLQQTVLSAFFGAYLHEPQLGLQPHGKTCPRKAAR